MNAILSFERRHVVVTTVANRKRHARTRHRLGRVLEVLELLELEHAHVHGHTIPHGYVQFMPQPPPLPPCFAAFMSLCLRPVVRGPW